MKVAPAKPGLYGWLDHLGITQDEVGQVIDMTGAAVCNKLAGRREWSLNEARKVAALVSARHGARLTIEQVFGPEELAEQPVGRG